MEIIKDTINVCNVSAKGETQAMAEGDVIVPDIKPDILKLLQVDAHSSVTDKYIENGRLVINGRVDYKILYVPDNGNEKIKSILTSMEFRQVVDSGGADADARIFVKPTVKKVEFNTVNSRKLHIRTVICIEYEVCRLNSFEISADAEMECLEKEYRQIKFENTVDVSEHTFTLSERLEVPSGTESIGEILKADVKISDTEYKAVTGRIIIKGNAGICVLYTDTEGDVRFTEAEIPFTEILDCDNITENTVCDIDYFVLGEMCNTEPDNDGDMRIINIDIDMCVSVKGTEISEKEILDDCFMPYMKTECEKELITLKTCVERPSVSNTCREVIELPRNVPEISGVYNIMSNPVITKTQQQKNKILCEGNLETYILYLTESTENPVYSYKKEIPFSYMIDCENDTEDMICETKSCIRHISYNLNSKGEVELRCVITIDCVLLKKSEFCNITNVSVTDKEYVEGIIVCFAEKGERVWDIAKRYTVPKETLIANNNIEDEILSENMRLFIPSK